MTTLKCLILLCLLVAVCAIDKVVFWKAAGNEPACHCDSCSCPSGALTQTVAPSGDGCRLSVYGFDPCCSQHDVCWERCGASRAQCNEAYKACLKNKCNEYGFFKRMGCKVAASIAKVAATCRRFQKIQRAHCTCQ